ncbi:MAG: endonuclease/exonuclease/phosphatase family protein [Phycisphaerales bacterium]|nr:endonuclease/exonuclease/phosphatase family protein [Phycisphaerales bacterium]
MNFTRVIQVAAMMSLVSMSYGQWDPQNGQWGKEDARDIRVMTWNVQDGICRTNNKADAFNNWNGIVRIIASIQPDVVILQECADNSGNGTGSGADTVTQLNMVADMLVNGGTDVFLGGTVGSYIKKFVPDYDLPYVYSSTNTDNFNRNLILSRFPIEDINNGGGAAISNFVVIPDEYQTGGSGGIRGYQFAEINLPDADYAGDLVIGNAHLKAGGSSSDFQQRETAAFNTAYFIDYYYNGAGTGMSDPNMRVVVPNSGDMLDEFTPVIWGGDLNQSPSSTSPSSILTRAEFFGGTDGTDRDRSDSSFTNASHPITGDTSTQGSSSRLDYICWQDSIVDVRRQFIFRSSGSGMSTNKIPEPARSFPINPLAISGIASDHRPVIVDFIMPAPVNDPCPSPPDFVDDDQLNFFDVAAFLSLFADSNLEADITGDGKLNFFDVSAFLTAFSAGCP